MKLFLEISSIGAACGKNRYEPVSRVLLSGVVRHSKELAREYLLESGSVEQIDSKKKDRDTEIINAYKKESSGVSKPDDFKGIEEKIVSVINKLPDVSKEEIERTKTYVRENLKKDCGKNVEEKVITKKKYDVGNKKMYYHSIGGHCIGGLHDATDSDIVIEIKTRMKKDNVRKNEYDLYQLIGYLLAMKANRGKIVQQYGTEIFDSDVETDSEYGLIDISEDKWVGIVDAFNKELCTYFNKLENIIANTDDLVNVFPRSDIPIAQLNTDGKLVNVNYKYSKFLTVFA